MRRMVEVPDLPQRECERRPHYSSAGSGCQDSGVTVSGIRSLHIRCCCTHKNYELVEFAPADMSNILCVSRCQVQLPNKKVQEWGGER